MGLITLLTLFISQLAFGSSAPDPKKAEPVEEKGQFVDLRKENDRILVPAHIWNLIENPTADAHGSNDEKAKVSHAASEDKSKKHGENPKEQPHEAKHDAKQTVVEFFYPSWKVILDPENEDSVLNIKTSEGGGAVDFGRLFPEGKRTVQLDIQFPDRFKNSIKSIYFVPAYRAQVRGVNSYGTGCKKWLDVSSFALKNWIGKKWILKVGDIEDWPIYGGTYVLVARDLDKVSVAQVTLLDSRYERFSCSRRGKKDL